MWGWQPAPDPLPSPCHPDTLPWHTHCCPPPLGASGHRGVCSPPALGEHGGRSPCCHSRRGGCKGDSPGLGGFAAALWTAGPGMGSADPRLSEMSLEVLASPGEMWNELGSDPFQGRRTTQG